MRRAILSTFLLATLPLPLAAQRYTSASGETPVALKMPYSGARHVAERSGGPSYLEVGGIRQALTSGGVELKPVSTVALTAEEEPQYGAANNLIQGAVEGIRTRPASPSTWE